jgi:hypothetical protein
MNSTGKIVKLCFLFLLTSIFIFPLCAEEPLPDDEKIPPGDEGTLISEEPTFDEEALIGKESSSSNDPLFDDDFFFNDESFVFEAPRLIFEVPVFETRSFNDVFSGLSPRQKATVMSGMGIRNSFEKDSSPTLIPNPDSGVDLLNSIMSKKPSHIIEALVVVPYNKRELDLLDIYNALRRIKNIQDHVITVRGNEYKIFKDTTRLESAQNRRPVSDPPSAVMLPFSETMYLKFVDLSMGDLYLRGDISISLYGLTYSLTNFRDVSYAIFRIMKAERFMAIIYLEPVKEGILIYSMSGIYIPSFVANRINLTSSMNYRITVLVNWITDGLRREENENQGHHFYQLQKE